MKLKLLIKQYSRAGVKEHCIASMDIELPDFHYNESDYDSYDLQFEKYVDDKKYSIKSAAKYFRKRNKRALEGRDWETVLIAESKANEIIKRGLLEESKLKIA